MYRATPCIVLSLFAAFSASADTIILKNGHRIVASSVTEDGEHVSYETPAGRMSILKSAVARIDRDNFTYSSAGDASQPVLSVPHVEPVRGYEDVARLTVHDDSVDFSYLAKLETDARTGSGPAMAKVAAGHYAAAQFLATKGNMDSAADHYRQALIYAPDNVGLLMNLALLYLRESKFTFALDPLEHALRIAPASGLEAAGIAKLMGWAYFGSNKLDRAIEEWKHAEELHPDPEVERALEKAQRDQAEEESYRQGETAHFALKYYGGAAPELAREILRALEDDFRDLEGQLDYTPPDQISVVLYTEQAFADITRAPGWVGALNDGRLRIPVQGLTSVTPDLARVLRHELTHSFVTQKSHGRAPTWLQEGIAQWMEGRRSDSTAGALLDAASQGGLPGIASLEGPWVALPPSLVALAYPWSLAAVESIIQNGGTTDIVRLLDHIANASSPEAALRETLHSDYADLEQQTAAYLKRAYLR